MAEKSSKGGGKQSQHNNTARKKISSGTIGRRGIEVLEKRKERRKRKKRRTKNIEIKKGKGGTTIKRLSGGGEKGHEARKQRLDH